MVLRSRIEWKRRLGQIVESTAFLPIMAVVSLLILVAASDALIYSASSADDLRRLGDAWFTTRQHALQLVFGLGVLAGVATLPLRWIRAATPWFLAVVFIAGILPFVPYVGVVSGGAARAVALGPIQWEPGPLLGVALLLWTSLQLARRPLGMWRRGVAVGCVGLVLLVAMLQPDFSLVPLILLPIGMQTWRAGIEGKRTILLAVVLGTLVAASAALQPYVAGRFEAWLKPQETAQYVGRDYLLLERGVNAGGITGQGYGNGHYVVQTGQAKSDYFFGHAVEELGLLRAALLLLLYIPILLLGVRVTELARNRFVAMIGTGMAAYLLTAVVIHAAVSLRLVPVTAIHLPFLSFGGSSLLACLVAFGFLLVSYREMTSAGAADDEDTSPHQLSLPQ